MDDSNHTNPFRITDYDADVLRLREKERIRNQQAKDQNKELKVWEKSKCGNKTEMSRGTWIRDFMKSTGEQKAKENENIPPKRSKVSSILERLDKYFKEVKPEERESTSGFIAKRREMFLLQMSLDIKKSEIKKLHEKACIKEEALKRSEQMLEEDATKFDAFLKENDKKAQEAIRKAEKESKRKLEKIQEIKKINQQIQVTQSMISKHKDTLDDCFKYKSFLDQLTPCDWVEKQKQIKKNRQKERRDARIKRRKDKWLKEKDRTLQEAKVLQENANSKSRRRRRQMEKKSNSQYEKAVKKLDIPPEPNYEDEPFTSSDEEISIYFKKPIDLLNVLSNLEEENLFLIQNTQEAEQSLDELVRNFKATQCKIQRKEEIQQENIVQINRSIEHRKNSMINIQNLGKSNKPDIIGEKDMQLLSKLSNKIHEVYNRCGYSDAGSIPNMLYMISNIEAKMEEIMLSIEDIPSDYVTKAEKIKGKKRRECKRAQQQAIQARAQEERNRKALERSMQPPKKATGKKVNESIHFFFLFDDLLVIKLIHLRVHKLYIMQVMYRSYLVNNDKVREEKDEEIQEDLDELKYLT